jgi:hypothetical protein
MRAYFSAFGFMDKSMYDQFVSEVVAPHVSHPARARGCARAGAGPVDARCVDWTSEKKPTPGAHDPDGVGATWTPTGDADDLEFEAAECDE